MSKCLVCNSELIFLREGMIEWTKGHIGVLIGYDWDWIIIKYNLNPKSSRMFSWIDEWFLKSRPKGPYCPRGHLSVKDVLQEA